DRTTGLERATLQGHTQGITSLAFAGSRALVSGSGDDKAEMIAPLGEVILWDAAPMPVRGADVKAVDPDNKTGASSAVIVGEGALAHTSQLLPLDETGKLVGKDKPAEQVEKVLDNLSAALAE